MNRTDADTFLAKDLDVRLKGLLTVLLTELTDQPGEAPEIISRYDAKVAEHFTAFELASKFIVQAFKTNFTSPGDTMNISTETVGRLLASARGYAQWGVGFATSLGLLSAANSKGLSDGFSDIFAGISQTVHGFTSVWQIGVVVIGPIAAVALARWSSQSAKTDSQAAAVKAAVVDPNTSISPEAKTAIVAAATEVTK